MDHLLSRVQMNILSQDIHHSLIFKQSSIGLFRFEGLTLNLKWGISSAGRAPALHAGGQRFDPAILHHLISNLKSKDSFKDLNRKLQILTFYLSLLRLNVP